MTTPDELERAVMTVCDHDIIEPAHNRKELREKIAGIIVRKVLQEERIPSGHV